MKYIDLLVSLSQRERSAQYRFLVLIVGASFFLVVFSGLVLWASHWLVQVFRAVFVTPIPVLGWVLALLGIALAAWASLVMWFSADGTPAPLAPTRRLVTHGPFRYCRNPMQLAIMIYVLGLGTALFSLVTGICALLFTFVLGGLYHRFVEERELRARFGEEYDRYRNATPFVLPRIWKHHDADSV
ncbi:methyltransferase family protein [Pseudodesulfovibrio senegalensis]|nr:isoprenylcysteine carboxylmethyltransferase family protein [Pseudodesulfovibrio senegalensis]